MNGRLTRSTPDYLRAAVTARARLGVAALAAELTLTPERTEELIWAHERATGDDTPYADCLDRGDVILANRSGLPLSRIENWIRDEFDFGWNVACPPSLQRVLDSLQETVYSAEALSGGQTSQPDAESTVHQRVIWRDMDSETRGPDRP